jgi:hypothetical protein
VVVKPKLRNAIVEGSFLAKVGWGLRYLLGFPEEKTSHSEKYCEPLEYKQSAAKTIKP